MRAGDVERIVASLHGGVSSSPEPVTGGWSGTEIWRVEIDGARCLVRIFAPGEEIVATREMAALEQGSRYGLPVQRVVARGDVDGRAVLLLEWIEGRELKDALASEPQQSRRYGEQFGELQARLHDIDPPPALPRAIDWPARDVYPDDLRARLEQLSADNGRLVHLDYHPGNVLVDNGRVSGLIDWTNARAGDPRFDLARSLLLLRLMPGLDAEMKVRFRPVVRTFMSGWQRSYRTRLGPIDGIAPFLAWAGYGLIADLDGKPVDSISGSAGQELRTTLALLERRVGRWMAASGLQ
ncbi:hypothetical protein BH23CHL2_BH23CHL2_04300 [soil metagenome]